MLMKGSVEERIMELQNKKREMMNAALSNKQSREKIKEERLSELSILFR